MQEKIRLIDSHAHIYGKEFFADFDTMLQRAAAAGVETIIVIGADLESSIQAVELARKFPNLYAAVGIHPHDASRVTEACYQRIVELAGECDKVVAIGEIGLDFYRDRSPRPDQELVFRRFIKIARELQLPVIIHDRDAHERVMAILREEGAADVGGVLHCFSGDLQMAKKCIELGFYISIPGTVTYPNNHALHEVVRGVRAEHLLVETDCPYLSPVPYRGKRNEPAFVRLAAEKIAELKGLSLADVARITTANSQKLFRLPNYDQAETIAYKIRNSLYLNITNRCSNRCSFCPKFDDFTVKGHQLQLKHEPSAREVLAAIAEHKDFEEIVFCGYGEPLIRLDLIKEVATELKRRGHRIRINTDGQANLVHGRNILPELAGIVDTISVSLNSADPAQYQQLCHSPFKDEAFKGICEFLRAAPAFIPNVIATAVTVPEVDIEAVRQLAESLGVSFREREFAEVG